MDRSVQRGAEFSALGVHFFSVRKGLKLTQRLRYRPHNRRPLATRDSVAQRSQVDPHNLQ